jgi:SpoVK/Ycf46/Vps4 family AAA+-type ATPase
LCWVENKSLDAKWLRKAKAQRIQEQSGKALSFINTDDVPPLGGAEVMQAWLDVTKSAFASDKAKAYGLPEPKGIVLVGVPGTGKSLTPKNVARSWGVPLIRLDIGAVYGGLVGATESNMRNLLQAIPACAPCVLWVDEIEKALGGKGGSSGDSGVSDRVAGALLTFMQENTAPVFIIATANSVENLRPELLRKGRIDEIFFVDLPDKTEREAIAKIHVERRKRDVTVLKPSEIALLCDGFSGAEIEQALLDAMKKSFSLGREVTIEDIKEAAESTTPLSKTMEKDITALRNWAKGKARYANKKSAEAAASGGRNLPPLSEGWKLK